MRIVCPTCGNAESRAVTGGSQRECSACYTRYEIKKPKSRKAAVETETTPDNEPEEKQEA